MVHDQAEGLTADLAFAQGLVPVHAGALLALGIVGVNELEPPEANGAVEATQRVVERGDRREQR